MPDIVSARPEAGAPVASDWGGQVHDALEGIQSGAASLAGITNASTVSVAVVFPRAYSSPPVVCLIASSVVVIPAYNALTTTGMNITARRTDGNSSATTQTIYWIAVGPPA